MAKKADVIQRSYLLRHLARVKGRYNEDTREWLVLEQIVEWVKAQRKRATKPGGLGK